MPRSGRRYRQRAQRAEWLPNLAATRTRMAADTRIAARTRRTRPALKTVSRPSYSASIALAAPASSRPFETHRLKSFSIRPGTSADLLACACRPTHIMEMSSATGLAGNSQSNQGDLPRSTRNQDLCSEVRHCHEESFRRAGSSLTKREGLHASMVFKDVPPRSCASCISSMMTLHCTNFG